MTPPLVIEPLSAAHDRLAFSCGVEALDRYLQVQAGQDVRRRVANCFVAVPERTTSIAGYYTLAATSLALTDVAAEESRRLPRYPLLPAVLIGRLAVDRRYIGRALGSALVFDAITRALRAEPAVFALVVDAKDEGTAGFYKHFGFAAFASRPMSFYLPMATAVKLAQR